MIMYKFLLKHTFTCALKKVYVGVESFCIQFAEKDLLCLILDCRQSIQIFYSESLQEGSCYSQVIEVIWLILPVVIHLS